MSKDTRNRILKVARDLFVKQGFSATSVRQIAGEAKIAKATIYHYFEDKEAIILTLLEHELDEHKEAFPQFPESATADQIIKIATESSIMMFRQSMDLIQVIRREVPAAQESLDMSFRGFWQSHTAIVAKAIEKGQEDGIYRADFDPMQAAQILITTVFGQSNVAFALGETKAPPQESKELLLDMFFRGIIK